MGSRVELFERIRRDRELEGLGLRALARRHGVHRRTVRQALASAIPPERKRPEGRPAPALGALALLVFVGGIVFAGARLSARMDPEQPGNLWMLAVVALVQLALMAWLIVVLP
jgi:transcriptional regulator with XRE-family HTH domain